MNKFEVGKWYNCYGNGYSAIKILSRTAKTINVMNEEKNCWRMKVKEYRDGTEFAVDTSVPKMWRDTFTYRADWESKE